MHLRIPSNFLAQAGTCERGLRVYKFAPAIQYSPLPFAFPMPPRILSQLNPMVGTVLRYWSNFSRYNAVVFPALSKPSMATWSGVPVGSASRKPPLVPLLPIPAPIPPSLLYPGPLSSNPPSPPLLPPFLSLAFSPLRSSLRNRSFFLNDPLFLDTLSRPMASLIRSSDLRSSISFFSSRARVWFIFNLSSFFQTACIKYFSLTSFSWVPVSIFRNLPSFFLLHPGST